MDKLTACADITQLWAQVDSGSFTRNCRSASGSVERAFADRQRARWGTSICFLAKAPAQFLAGFSCADTSVPGFKGGRILCFREASAADLRDYHDNYDTKYRQPVIAYLKTAAACPASNGDALEAPQTMAPQQGLKLIAKFELGFMLSLGKTMPAHGMIEHGYASLDPAISSQGGAVEFVEIFSGEVSQPVQSVAKGKPHGIWQVEFDDMAEVERNANQQFRQQGAPVSIDFTNYSISVAKPRGEDDAAKLYLIEEWQDAISYTLLDWDFLPVSDAELRSRSGRSYEDMKAFIPSMSAYGDLPEDKPYIRGLEILVNESAPCAGDGETGIMIAMVTSMGFGSFRATDYGGVMFALVGLGDCATSSSAKSDMRSARDAAISEFYEYLEGYQ